MGFRDIFNGEQSVPQLRKALSRTMRELAVSEDVARDAEAAYQVALEDAPDGDALRSTRDKRDDADLVVRRQRAQINALKEQIATIVAREKAETAKALLREVLALDLAIASALATAHAHIVKDAEARGRLLELGCSAECNSLPAIPVQTYELGNQYGRSPVSPKHDALERFGYQITLLKRSLEGAS